MSKPKSKSKSSAVDPVEKRLRTIAWLGIYAGLMTPLIYLPWIWHPFSAGKVWFLQVVVGLTFPGWAVLAWRRPEYRPPRSLLLWALGAHLLSMALSVPGAVDWHLALWGSTQVPTGLLSRLHLAAWLVMAVSLARSWNEWRRLLLLVCVGGAVSSVVALLQVWFPSVLGIAAAQRVPGLMGNPVFLGAYQLQILFLTAFLWARSGPLSARLKWMAVGSMTLCLVALLLTGSRGPMMAVVIGAVVAAATYVTLSGRKRLAVGAAVGLLLMGAGYATMVKVAVPHRSLAGFWSRHENIKRFFVLHDDSDRMSIWRLTLAGVRERPLLGWGPGNYENLFDRHFDPWQGCGNNALDDAHNLPLQIAATQGVVGLLTALFLWGALLTAVIQAIRRKQLEPLPGALLIGLVSCFQIPNLFNPESPAPLFLSHLLLALAVTFTRSPSEPTATPSALPRWALGATLGVGVLLATWVSVLPARASFHSAEALKAYHQGNRATAWRELQAALATPTPYLEEQLAIGTQLLVQLGETRALESFSPWKDLLSEVRGLAERYFQHHRKNHFRLSWLIAQHRVGTAANDASLVDSALRGYRSMLEEQPRRQEIMYELGRFLAEEGQLDEAEAVFQKALELDPRVGQSHFRYGAFVWQYRKEAERGSRMIREGTLTACAFAGKNFSEKTQTAQGLSRQGDIDGLRALVPREDDRQFDPTGRNYLLFASYAERLGMTPERDQLLRATVKWSPGGAKKARMVLEGRVPRVADVLQD